MRTCSVLVKKIISVLQKAAKKQKESSWMSLLASPAIAVVKHDVYCGKGIGKADSRLLLSLLRGFKKDQRNIGDRTVHDCTVGAPRQPVNIVS